jgi:hypothetical protein
MLKTRKVDLPKLRRGEDIEVRAMFTPSTVNEKDRTVELVFTEGARGLRSSWLGDKWYEELSLEDGHVRLTRLNNGAPLLDTHNRWTLKDVIGVIERAWVEVENGKKVGKALARFSERAEVEPIFQDVKNGILRKISVGYKIHKFEKIEGGEDKIPVYRATDWEPLEISLVPVPFDDGASVRTREADEQEVFACEVLDAERADEPNQNHKESEMKMMRVFGQEVRDRAGDEGSAGGSGTAPAPVDINKAREEAAEKARAEERERCTEIRALAKKHGLEDKFADELVSRGVKIDAARAQILDKLAEKDEKSDTRGQQPTITHGARDEVSTFRAGVVNAITHRARPAEHKLEEMGRDYMGDSLYDMARESLEMQGIRTKRMHRDEVAKRALTSGDLPLILADATNKFLRTSYEGAPSEWKKLGSKRVATNYHAIKNLKLGEAGELEEIAEGGKIVLGSLDESREQYAIADYGKRVVITQKVIINDDLGAIAQIPVKFGRAAARLEARLFWEQLTANGNMSDGKALFHSDHGNLAAVNAAIAVGPLGIGRKSMRLQTELGSDQPMNLNPKYLVVPAALETVGEQFIAQSVRLNAKTATEVNPFAGRLELISEGRLDAASATAWYLFCDPSEYDTIQYAYLAGKEGPVVESQPSFDELGTAIRIVHTFGAGVLDYRGMFKNIGV